MGLPGAGKTTLAAALSAKLFFSSKFIWHNADAIREKFNDWDFSLEGRIRQSIRMRELADKEEASTIVIMDLVAPLKVMRDNIDPDILVWVDTIKEGRFEDTNKMFEPPEKYSIRVTTQDSKYWATIIGERISSESKLTVL
jgi:adenylylsulfate kinase